MTVTQILKGLDKDIQSELKPLFSVQTNHSQKDPTGTFKAIMLQKAWELQEKRDTTRPT